MGYKFQNMILILNIKYVFVYNETKSLMVQHIYFYSIDTGVWKEYDTNGNIIKEEDMDAYYKITINDFLNLMKEQYKISYVNYTNYRRRFYNRS